MDLDLYALLLPLAMGAGTAIAKGLNSRRVERWQAVAEELERELDETKIRIKELEAEKRLAECADV